MYIVSKATLPLVATATTLLALSALFQLCICKRSVCIIYIVCYCISTIYRSWTSCVHMKVNAVLAAVTITASIASTHWYTPLRCTYIWNHDYAYTYYALYSHACTIDTTPVAVEIVVVQVVTVGYVELFDTELFAGWWLSLGYSAAQHTMLFVCSIDSRSTIANIRVAVI